MAAGRDPGLMVADLGGIAEKLGFYGEELAFALRAPQFWRDRLRLIAHTAAFHWRNWRKAPTDAGSRIALALDLDGYRARVTLRPKAGDMSVFYETLARNSYAVAYDILDPASVRVIVDAGANAGYSALYFAARYPAARILSIEPNPDNFALLTANTIAEPRIERLQACLVGRPNPDGIFISTAGPAWGFQMNTEGRGVRVPAVTLSDLMKHYSHSSIDLLKIDIEGAERDVFAHARQVLPHVSVIAAELHGSYDLAAFNRDLAGSGLAASVSPTARDPHLVLAWRR